MSPIVTKTTGLFLLLTGLLVAERILFLHFSPLPLYADEAQYWTWAKALDWGFFSKPPMVAAGIWLTTSLCGDGEACVRLSAPIMHGLTALLVYATGRRLFSPQAAAVAGLVYLTLPAVWLSSLIVSTDVYLLFFWALGLYGFTAAMQSGQSRWWWLAGLAVGLGLQSKYTMILFPASACWWMLWQAEGRAQLQRWQPWAAILLAAAIFAPNLLWNARHGWVSFAHTQHIAQMDGSLGHVSHLLEFIGAQAGVFGPLLFPLLLWLLRGWFRQPPAIRQLLAFVWPMLLAISLQAFLSRAHANWAAAIYVPASLAVVGWAWQHGRRVRGLIWASLGLHLLVGAVFHLHQPIMQSLGDFAPRRDPFARLYGGPELGWQVNRLRQQYPDHGLLVTDRKLAATLIYYAAPPAFDLKKWNGNATIDDHYELAYPLTAADRNRDFLLVQPWPIAQELQEAFEQVTPLPDIVITLSPHDERRYYPYLLRHYRPLSP